MKAIVVAEPGGASHLQWNDVADPAPADDEVLVHVAAAGVNRADILQRQGHYPPPADASPLLGLEVSGTIVDVGKAVTRWQVGDTVAALLSGGGYAELVAIPHDQLLPIPDGISLVDAAALPEATCTVWSNLVMTAGMQAGDWVLIHGGASGIGTCAIQLVAALGARAMTTVSTPEKATQVTALGARSACLYKVQDFVEHVADVTSGHGADIILDMIGAAYLDRNVNALAESGRLVVIGLQGGTKAELDLNRLMRKRGAIHATTLRSRDRLTKAGIVAEVAKHVWPLVAARQVTPVVHRTFAMREARSAHELMEQGSHTGKLLLVT